MDDASVSGPSAVLLSSALEGFQAHASVGSSVGVVNSLTGLEETHFLGLGVHGASIVLLVLSGVSALASIVGGSGVGSSGVEGWAEAGLLSAVPSTLAESVLGTLSSDVHTFVSSSA